MTSKISIPLKKLSKTSFDLVEKSFDSRLSGEWNGTVKTEEIFLDTYIQEKYKDILHIVPFVRPVLSYEDDNVYNTPLVSLIDYIAQKAFVVGRDPLEHYIKKFRNTRKRFTYFSINTEIHYDFYGEIEYHSVSALYDKKINKVEIFDSIGSDFTPFKKALKNLFVEIYGKRVKVVYMTDRCVAFGKLASKCDRDLYRYTSNGFCVVWTLWFLELRVSNPDIPKEKLIEKALKQLNIGDKVCRLLRGYGQFVDKTVAKYSVTHTESNLIIKPKTPVIAKKDYSYLYALLASLVGSIAAFGLLNKFIKKRLSLDRQSKNVK